MNNTPPIQRQLIDVQFLQSVIIQTHLELKVSSLSEQSYRALAKRVQSWTGSITTIYRAFPTGHLISACSVSSNRDPDC
jgi:hypothetical protein